MVETTSPRTGRTAGFTLIEALVAMAILGIALVVAIPNIQRTRIKARATQAVRQLEGVFIQARTEALRRHSPVGVRVENTGRLVVFEDWDEGSTPPNNGVYDAGADPLIREVTLDSAVAFVAPSDSLPPASGNLLASSPQHVLFRPDGTLATGAGAFYVQDDRANRFRLRLLPTTGTHSLEKATAAYWTPRREEWQWKY